MYCKKFEAKTIYTPIIIYKDCLNDSKRLLNSFCNYNTTRNELTKLLAAYDCVVTYYSCVVTYYSVWKNKYSSSAKLF